MMNTVSVNDLKKKVISVVLPCLNEEVTVGFCISKAVKSIQSLGYDAEVIIVDNGCTDRSVQISTDAGARVIVEKEKGYGNALRAGIEAAKGDIIIMADADDTYDLLEIRRFVEPIVDGRADFVIGNRFKDIKKGAMPFLHQYLGNPVLSFLFRMMFSARVRDVHCGMRAFTREAYQRLGLVTKGMEFASEMLIRAGNQKIHIEEVDITYHLRKGESKLRTFRDGWRHLRLMLLYSPDFLFILPALLLWMVGLGIIILLAPGPVHIGKRVIDLHSMLSGAVSNIIGLQLGAFGLIAKAYGHFTGLRHDRLISTWSGFSRLEHGILFGVLLILGGLSFCGYVFYIWTKTSFGNIHLLRELILSLVVLSNGMVIVATSFILSLMAIRHKSVNNGV